MGAWNTVIANPITWALLAIAALSYYIVSSVRTYWRLRHFPGPRLAAWSQLWYIRAALSGQCHLRLSDASTKYGRLVRIAPNMLLTSDPELFRKINVPRSGYYRDEFYKAFKFSAEVNNVFSETDSNRHTYLRKRVAAGYSGRDNPAVEPDIDRLVLVLVKSWSERYIVSRTKMDLAMQIQYLTLDIITALCFGEPFGWVASDSDLYSYIEAMKTAFPMMFYVSAVPMISSVLRIPWIQNKLAPSVTDQTGIGRLKSIGTEIVARRFAERDQQGKQDTGRKDMIASFIENKLSSVECTDEFLLTILAGNDTSASSLAAGLAFILSHQRVIRKLQAECDSVDISKDEVISYARALQLPYLQACIKETLRVHPAGTGINPRIVPPQGDYYNGTFIPGGTVIGQCAWNLFSLNYDAYGPDADQYRPERWIEAASAAEAGKPERLDKMEKTNELIFSYGEYKCLGMRVAQIELAKILFELVRRFEFNFVDPLRIMETHESYGLFVQEGMWVTVDHRPT